MGQHFAHGAGADDEAGVSVGEASGEAAAVARRYLTTREAARARRLGVETRVGVGQRGLGWNLADWVLSHYQTAEEQEIADRAYEQAADAVLEYLKNGINSAMNRYNTKKPKKEKPPKEGAPAGEEAAASEQAEEGKE